MDDPSPLVESGAPFRMGAWRVVPRRLILQSVEMDAKESDSGAATRKITPKVMEVAVVLAARAGDVVTKEELLEEVWPDVYVSDGAVRRTISQLRDALDDDADQPRYIETVPTVGYRLLVDVQPLSPQARVPPGTAGFPPAVLAGDPPPEGETPAPFHGPNATERPDNGGSWRVRAGVIGGGLALALILAVALARWWHAPAPVRTVDVSAPVPLTALPGDELMPRLSPNGKQVAYTHARSGTNSVQDSDLFVKLVDEAASLQITHDPGMEMNAMWSPDGMHLAFVRWTGASKDDAANGKEPACGVHRVSVLGGPVRRLASCAPATSGGPPMLSWAPDGRAVAFPRSASDGRTRIHAVSIGLRVDRRLTDPPPGESDSDPAFAPTGDEIAFVRTHADGTTSIRLQPVDRPGEARVLHEQERPVWGLHWSANGHSLFYLSDGPNQRTALWRLTRNGGIRERLPLPPDATDLGDPHIQNGDLVYVRRSSVANLWRLRAGSSMPQVLPATSSRTDLLPSWSPDASHIAFFSDRTGSIGLWVGDTSGTEAIHVSEVDGTDLTPPVWLPGGNQLAFGTNRGVFIASIEAGVTRRVSRRWARTLQAHDSGDLYATVMDDAPGGDGPYVVQIRPDSADVRVTPDGQTEVLRHVSDDGLYVTSASTPARLLHRGFDGGAATEVGTHEAFARALPLAAWTVVGDGFVFTATGPDDGILLYDRGRGVVERVYQPSKEQVRAVSASPDGADLVFDQIEPGGIDAHVLRGFVDP